MITKISANHQLTGLGLKSDNIMNIANKWPAKMGLRYFITFKFNNGKNNLKRPKSQTFNLSFIYPEI